ncbi:MAG: hypothetical protein LC658_00955 [Bacteroidales bacterium]|nr:hypothetical protein [Bacteroidales bacterium]
MKSDFHAESAQSEYSGMGVCWKRVTNSIFGDIKENIVHLHIHDRAAGYLVLEKARVRWFLSINYDTIPASAKEKGMSTYHSITIEGEEFEFSGGFTELHTKSYEHILSGNGFRANSNIA